MSIVFAFQLVNCKIAALTRKHTLATPNYGYEKRQKELAKKKKKEEKLKHKAERKVSDGPEEGDQDTSELDPGAEPGSAAPAVS